VSPWLRVDDGFTGNRKILALGTDQRRWTWMRILCYAAHQSSPEIPHHIGHEINGATPKYIADLLEIGLLDEDGPHNYVIHDWDDYNPKDPTNPMRQARYRQRQRNAQSNATSNAEVTHTVTPPVTDETVTEVTPHALARARVPTPPQTTRPLERDVSVGSNVTGGNGRKVKPPDLKTVDEQIGGAA
jgi:hypothetical protein